MSTPDDTSQIFNHLAEINLKTIEARQVAEMNDNTPLNHYLSGFSSGLMIAMEMQRGEYTEEELDEMVNDWKDRLSE